jgi:hypothetical protein
LGTSCHRNVLDWLTHTRFCCVYIPHDLELVLTAAARTPLFQLARAHRRSSLHSHPTRLGSSSLCDSSRGRALHAPPTPAGTKDGGDRRLGGHRDLPHLLRVPRGAWPADPTLLAPSSHLRSSHLIITLTLPSVRCCAPTSRCDPRADAACFLTPTAGSAPPPATPASMPSPFGARRRQPPCAAEHVVSEAVRYVWRHRAGSSSECSGLSGEGSVWSAHTHLAGGSAAD